MSSCGVKLTGTISSCESSAELTDLKSVEHTKQCGGTSCDEEDGKWDPAKDLIGGDLVLC
jgi:hypothetical protein